MNRRGLILIAFATGILLDLLVRASFEPVLALLAVALLGLAARELRRNLPA